MFDNNCRKDLRQFRHVILVPVFFIMDWFLLL